MRTPRSIVLLLASAVALVAAAAAQEARAIDTTRSAITIHVGKAGLFSAFGHDHTVRAPIASGSVDQAAGVVSLTINSGELVVLDPDLEPDKRAEVQATMLGPKVLDAERFPVISFRSLSATREKQNAWRVRGELTLHGVTRPVEFRVMKEGDRYQGTASLKQRDFGITPVSVAGGTVKVKDELRLTFEVWLLHQP